MRLIEKRSGRILGLLTGILLMSAVVATAAEAPPSFDGLILFGDSLSDAGNVWSLTLGVFPSSPPHYEGRFSNGPVWIERFGVRAGLDGAAAAADGGSNFAHGGAETGGGTVYLVIPNVGTQIDRYLDDNIPDADDLFVVWGGGNDMLGGQTDPADPVANLADHVATLAAQGARSFLVPNLPLLGQAPRYVGGGSEAAMDVLTSQYNALLAQRMDALAGELDVTILQFDVAATFSDILADPAAFGLTNVTDMAYDEDSGSVVPNAEEYLFWDEIHPTATAHRLLGDAAFASVYQPAGPGDANCDGRIDDDDLSMLLAHWPSGGCWFLGDFDASEGVDDSDLSLLAANWSAREGSVGIPEPAMSCVLVAGAVLLFRRRR